MSLSKMCSVFRGSEFNIAEEIMKGSEVPGMLTQWELSPSYRTSVHNGHALSVDILIWA